MRRALTATARCVCRRRINVDERVGLRQERTARILVVEEDPEARATLDLLLGARWNVTVVDAATSARDAARAIALRSGDRERADARAERHRAGPACCAPIATTQDVPLILMSRTAGQHETIAGLEAGADDFLVKPFSGRELLVRVQTRLELTAMRRRNAQQEEALANLQRTLKARDEFLSAASHELRTPITTLSLQTDGLLSIPGRAPTAGGAPTTSAWCGGSTPSGGRSCGSTSSSISCSTSRG